ncbi:hypothetical protein [Natronorubrum sp. FCH18a]|uniref:hypothetical protein n=1 Tax=Natronorubrum sp. FCH18a TaxID=3447018 RepID=UPI003F519B36
MTTHDASAEENGFVRFFRNYTKTWVHTVATAGLTAFGTLTVVHRWFAALAIASYLVPPIVLYLRSGRARPRGEDASAAASSGETGSSSGDGRESGNADRSGQSERADAREQAEATATTDPSAEPASNAAAGTTTEAPTNAASETAAGTATGETSDAESHATDDQHPDVGSSTADSNGAALEHADATDSESAEAAESEDADATDSDDIEAGGRGGRADEPVGLDEDEPDAADDTRADSTAGETAETPAETPPEWHAVDAPTDATLRGVIVSAASGGYAVGDGGTVLASGENGDEGGWNVLLEDGPAAGGNDLRGVDATAGGGAVWVAGDSGSLGRIDAETGRHVDYTAPEDITDNWLGVAVAGDGGDETVLLINGSGAILRGRYRDETLEWTGPEKPGSGSSLSGVALLEDGVGYCCDTNDGVFETTDGGESFERVGLEGADGTLTDVATTGEGECLVTADDGVVHRYDGPTWTPERVADQALSGIASRGERVAVCTDDAVYERDGANAEWERFDVDAPGPLLGVSIDAGRGVAVGEGGTLVERD